MDKPCDDCLRRQEVLDAIQKLNIPEDMCVFEIISHIEVAIATLPPVAPQPKTGRWIEMPMEFMEDFDGSGVHVLKDPLECSECGCRSSKATEYCPHCGAKMTETIWRN